MFRPRHQHADAGEPLHRSFAGAGGQQPAPQARRRSRRHHAAAPEYRIDDDRAPVGRADEPVEPERPAVERRVTGDRGVAAGADPRGERALGGEHRARRGRARADARGSTMSSRSVRHSMPTMPWPIAGSMSCGARRARIRDSSPRRSSPAAASTVASQAPASSLARRVSTLPRSTTTSRSGRRWRNWHLPAQARSADARASGQGSQRLRGAARRRHRAHRRARARRRSRSRPGGQRACPSSSGPRCRRARPGARSRVP